MEKKFTMPNNAPPITLAIPATVVPTTPNTATKASCSVPAPPAASAKAWIGYNKLDKFFKVM